MNFLRSTDIKYLNTELTPYSNSLFTFKTTYLPTYKNTQYRYRDSSQSHGLAWLVTELCDPKIRKMLLEKIDTFDEKFVHLTFRCIRILNKYYEAKPLDIIFPYFKAQLCNDVNRWDKDKAEDVKGDDFDNLQSITMLKQYQNMQLYIIKGDSFCSIGKHPFSDGNYDSIINSAKKFGINLHQIDE